MTNKIDINVFIQSLAEIHIGNFVNHKAVPINNFLIPAIYKARNHPTKIDNIYTNIIEADVAKNLATALQDAEVHGVIGNANIEFMDSLITGRYETPLLRALIMELRQIHEECNLVEFINKNVNKQLQLPNDHGISKKSIHANIYLKLIRKQFKLRKVELSIVDKVLLVNFLNLLILG